MKKMTWILLIVQLLAISCSSKKKSKQESSQGELAESEVLDQTVATAEQAIGPQVSSSNLPSSGQENGALVIFLSSPTLTASISTSAQVDLSWSTSTGTGAISYAVKRSTSESSGFLPIEKCTNISATTCQDSTVVPGSVYYYLVTVTDDNSSVDSNVVQAKAIVIASAPTLVLGHGQSARLDLSWNVSDGTPPVRYTVKRSSTSDQGFVALGGCIDISENSCNDSSGTVGVNYYYQVIASNYGFSAASSTVGGRSAILPSAPVLTATITHGDQTDLAWSASDGSPELTYTVMRSLSANSGFSSLPGCINSSLTTCIDETSLGGTRYYYKVKSENFGGQTESNIVAVDPIDDFAIADLALAGAGSILVSWNRAPGATQYQVAYALTADGPYSALGCTAADPTDSCVTTGLVDGTNYFFKVIATNSTAGSLSSSGQASAIPNGSTFNGWSHIKAVGAKAAVSQASDLSATSAQVTLSWEGVTMAFGSVDSYNVYRATNPGSQNYSVPYASNIAASSRVFSDTAVSAGITYYYEIAPVSGGQVVVPATAADSELRVIIPPSNMVLLHRWAANKEICQLAGKTIDRTHNYRCEKEAGKVPAPGTDENGNIDLGPSLFIDAFEQGCNYSYSAVEPYQCESPAGCIGTHPSPQSLVRATLGSVYYSRQSGKCFVNVGGASNMDWQEANLASVALRGAMGSAAPGLPPFTNITQVKSADVCKGQSVVGLGGSKRLLKRREHLLVSAWDSSLSDAAINTIESGVNLHTTNHCNANYASPQGNASTDIAGSVPSLAFGNGDLPSSLAKDTLPGCLFADCSGTGVGLRSLRTGSVATSACVSRYGAQDLAGNIYEFVSDQVTCDATACVGVAKESNSADSTNGDLQGVRFDDTDGPRNTISTLGETLPGKMQFPVGIPIVGANYLGDAVLTLTAAQLHKDTFSIGDSSAIRAGAAGGDFKLVLRSGRFTSNFRNDAINNFGGNSTLGFRCAIAAE